MRAKRKSRFSIPEFSLLLYALPQSWVCHSAVRFNRVSNCFLKRLYYSKKISKDYINLFIFTNQ